MVAALSNQRLSQQPTQPTQVDRSLGLSAGLVGVLYPTMGSAKANGNASLVATRDGLAYTTSSNADWWMASSSSLASVNATWTILTIVEGTSSNTAGSGLICYCERPNDTQIVKVGIERDNRLQLVIRDLSGNLSIITGFSNVRDDNGARRALVATRRAANDHRIYVAGQFEASSDANINGSFGQTISVIGNDPQDTGSYLQGASVPLVLVWNRSLSDAEIARVSRNPWQVLRRPTRRLYLASSRFFADTTLNGSIQAVSSASGAISTAIQLSGSALSLAAAAGALTTAIRFSGSANVASSSSGALTTSISLVGLVAGQAAAYGALSTAIPLSGTAQARTVAIGELVAPGTGLSGYARAVATVAGDLSTSVRLSGGASVSSKAVGSLYTATALVGTAIVRVTASGALSDNKGGTVSFDATKVAASRRVIFPGGLHLVNFPGGTKIVSF